MIQMINKFIKFAALSILLISNSLTSEVTIPFTRLNEEVNLFQMTPLPSELLNKPISLPNCPVAKIVEWRGSKVDAGSIRIIDEVCKLVLTKMQILVYSTNIISISIIPNNDEIRNLNDSEYRFANRVKHYKDGRLYRIKGYTSRIHNHIFISSDKFATVLAHELYHILSWNNGLYINDIEDEKNAKMFTQQLGLGI